MTVTEELTMAITLLSDARSSMEVFGFNQPEVATLIHRINELMDDIFEKVFPYDKYYASIDRAASSDSPELDGNDIPNLVEYIGTPAMLEQLSEECCELGKASLKMARELRGENKTHKKYSDILSNLVEEISDVKVSIYHLVKNGGLCTYDDIRKVMVQKNDRMRDRLKDEQKNTETVRFNNDAYIKRYKKED